MDTSRNNTTATNKSTEIYKSEPPMSPTSHPGCSALKDVGVYMLHAYYHHPDTDEVITQSHSACDPQTRGATLKNASLWSIITLRCQDGFHFGKEWEISPGCPTRLICGEDGQWHTAGGNVVDEKFRFICESKFQEEFQSPLQKQCLIPSGVSFV